MMFFKCNTITKILISYIQVLVQQVIGVSMVWTESTPMVSTNPMWTVTITTVAMTTDSLAMAAFAQLGIIVLVQVSILYHVRMELMQMRRE